MKLSITVDVEKDVGAVDTLYGIHEGLPVILDLMRNFNIKGTFFISGEILEYLDKTSLLETILNENHEIASHGYSHLDYRDWSKEKIGNEILKSKEELKRYTGVDVVGYRSPQFRVNEKIIDVLKSIGFRYDSSIPEPNGFSAASLLRGVKFTPDIVDGINDDNFKEFVISSVPVIKIPHGIFWINLLGFKLYRYFFERYKEDEIIVLYMHPFDFVKYKNRVKFPTLIENVLYPIKDGKFPELFKMLLLFWNEKNVDFITLKQAVGCSDKMIKPD
jgi:peptidoglycan/xylan/chitin deacetylase (PgdA/CDA1 family)